MYSIHFALSAITQVEEFELDEKEATKLAAAIERVNKHYKVSVIPPKTLAWINLLTAFGTVYGPRGVSLYRKSRKGKRTVMGPQPVAATGIVPQKAPQTIDAAVKPVASQTQPQSQAARIPTPPVDSETGIN